MAECGTLGTFIDWCEEHKIKISSKIKITGLSTSHRYGVIAQEDIKQYETLVEIPRHITLSPLQSSIADRLKEFEKANKEKLEETSGWIPLLLSLMSEIKMDGSLWAPYLSLCPVESDFDQPMFWSEEEKQEELAGLSMLWDVQRDLFNIEKEYQQFVVPFIEANQDVMSLELHSLALYKHMVGFVMSYSFTDSVDNVTLMVPVADIFNHHSNNNAALSFENKSILKMLSMKPIKKGEEIFNTFGKLGNAQLLHMYGFVEKTENSYDTMEIPLMSIVDILEAADSEKLPVLQAMLAYMRKMGIADEKEPFTFCSAGLKSGPDMYAVLRILHMELKEFTGLLQDHVKWYQDGYFVYLLELVQEATSVNKSEESEKAIDLINDSDDEVIIVKEVKGNRDSRSVNEAVEKNITQTIESGTTGDFSMASQDMTPSAKLDEPGNSSNVDKSLPLIINKLKDEATAESLKVEEQHDIETPNIEVEKKQSPNSEGQKKSRSRKRKCVQPILNCEDSDDEVVIEEPKPPRKANHAKLRKSAKEKSSRIERAACGDKKKTTEAKGDEFPAGLEEEPYLSAKDNDHSEDPEDGTDDEDSETHLQLTYDQINSILPPSWKATMESVIVNALATMKEDEGEEDKTKMSGHKLMAYRIRQGQRKILQLFEKSLAS